MKKIKVTIVTAAEEDYPGCADILGICPEIDVHELPAGLRGRGAWTAISNSDVLVLDEAALEREGVSGLRAVQRGHPLVRLLLILDKSNENKEMEALSLGFSGVIERTALRSLLRRAIPAVYTGEAWVSRRLTRLLRRRLLRRDVGTLPGLLPHVTAYPGKLN